MQSTDNNSTKSSTVFVNTRVFLNSQKCTQGSLNWKVEYNRGLKTYADIVKSKSSQVYSTGNITKANNNTQIVNRCVNTQSRVFKHKRKQGVKNTQGGDFHNANTGNMPHVLPVRSIYQNVKKCKHNSVVANKSTVKKSSSGVKESNAINSSRTTSVNKGKNSVNSGVFDFAMYNKFSVLSNDKSEEMTAVGHDSSAAANEAVTHKVSQKNDGNGETVSHGVDSCVVHNSPVIDDKYNLQLAFRPRHRATIASATNVQTFKNWDNQTQDKFGFIPLGDLMLPTKNDKIQSRKSMLKIHDQVRESKNFNFMCTQIQVKSQLNADAWDKYLHGYWDKQLGYLIRYGFPLDFDHSVSLINNEINHKSATDFKEDIEMYLQEEKDFGAILGPFNKPPLKDLHISPFMTREKADSNHRRVIIDLSFPPDHSINAGVTPDTYLGTPFLLTLPTIDDITRKIIKLGKGSLLYKIDVSRAFRHVKMDPKDYSLLGLRLQDYFIDTCLPFGFRHGSAIFQRLSDAVRHFMRQKGHQVTNYIDDVIGHATVSQANPSFQCLKDLLLELGFALSDKKMVAPTTKCICLGIELDTETFTAAIPADKLEKISKMCQQWQHKVKCKKRELQSLLGSLLYISKCVHSSRPFLNRMLDLLRASHKHELVTLNVDFKRDLNWFCEFLPVFNGSAFFKHDSIQGEIELDASLEGLGAIYNNQVYAVPLAKGYLNMDIAQLEMLNILLALRCWASQWATKTILVRCDNAAVVTILNSGKTKDPTLAAICRNISMETAKADIRLNTVHIPGKLNVIADSLSRFHISKAHRDKVHQWLPGATWLFPPSHSLTINWQI